MKLLKIMMVFWFVGMVPVHGQGHEPGEGRAAASGGVPQISYIGFNTLKPETKSRNVGIFVDYIATIKPIMTKHGMTLDVYRVDHSSMSEMPVDFITFGTAPDQKSFQSFFANPDFQAAFPKLVSIIEEHFVTFVDKPLIPEPNAKGYTQLSLDWLKSTDDMTMQALHDLDVRIAALGRKIGARRTHRVAGLMASTGLTDDVSPAEPPNVVSVWHMMDPYAFLDDGEVGELSAHAKLNFKMSRSYWISKLE